MIYLGKFYGDAGVSICVSIGHLQSGVILNKTVYTTVTNTLGRWPGGGDSGHPMSNSGWAQSKADVQVLYSAHFFFWAFQVLPVRECEAGVHMEIPSLRSLLTLKACRVPWWGRGQHPH